MVVPSVYLRLQMSQLGDSSSFGAEEASLKLSSNVTVAHSENLPICIYTSTDVL